MKMAQSQVLVVDDSPTELKAISHTLATAGYKVTTAKDGEEALNLAQTGVIDLIVLDVIMPKLNGFQVCRQIKSSPQTGKIKVILLTGKNQESDKFWGKKQGADLYMTKPFSETDLLANVASLL
jgi:twitching motility two-component system response regulator PilH